MTTTQRHTLTEAEAFRAIAERFATGTQRRTDFGICAEIRRFEVEGQYTSTIIGRMYQRCYSAVHDAGESAYGYAYGWQIENGEYVMTKCGRYISCVRNDEGRALACLWMALDAEEEARHVR